MKKDDDESDEETVQLESNISKALSDQITKVVIILVLIMLFMLPIMSWNTYLDMQLIYNNSMSLMVKQYDERKSWTAYQQTVDMTIENVGMINEDLDIENQYPVIVMRVADPSAEAVEWNDVIIEIKPNEGDIRTDEDDYRTAEKTTVSAKTASGLSFEIIYSIETEAKQYAGVNIARTVWVIIVLTISAIYFSNATNRLVLHPLERMLEIVKKIAKDPSSAAAQDEMQNAGVFTFMKGQQKGKQKKAQQDTNMETAILEQAIQKIGHLLTLGFGDAGSAIIAQNISSGGDMNPMIPGQKIQAIIGFCFIHDFAVINEQLQEDVIIFIN